MKGGMENMKIEETDVEFLLKEYKQARKQQFTNRGEYPKESSFFMGMARGLEMALIRMGLLNNDLDKITQEAYHEVMGE